MLSCERETQIATDQLLAQLDAADDACSRDSDCVGVSIGSVCTDGCSGGYVSKAGKAEFERAVSAVEHGICADFAERGCHYIPSGCPLQGGAIACVHGHCTLDDSTTTSNAGALSCDERVSRARDEWLRALPLADRECNVDSDCVDAPAPSCISECGARAILAADQKRLQEAVLAIDSDVCGDFESACGGGGGACRPAVPAPICWNHGCEAFASCVRFRDDMVREMTATASQFGKGCMSDSDCRLITLAIRCLQACPGTAVIASPDTETVLKNALEPIEGHDCSVFEAGCAAAVPPLDCPPAPSGVTCNAGQCVAVP
jgi:hypothetical protein